MNERCSSLVLPAASLARTVTVWAPSDGASEVQLPNAPLSILQVKVTPLKPSLPDSRGVNGPPITAPFAGAVTVRFGAPRSSVKLRVTDAAVADVVGDRDASTVYWPSVVIPCGEYGDVQPDVLPPAPPLVLQATLVASSGKMNVMLGAVFVYAGGVLTPVAPVDLSTVKSADGALARLLEACPEPSWEMTLSVCEEPSAYGARSGWNWNGAALSVARKTPST